MLGRRQDEQKDTYARGQPLIAGETVVPATYTCLDCDYLYVVEEGRITNLPVCPRCQGETWELAS
jgi:Zn finger protein HypA/HybF involved in hydrogenase expression